MQQPLLAINWDTLGQSEFDLPATLAGAGSNQHVPPLVLNLATLGQSEIVMPGDETGMDVAVVTESAAVQVAGSRLPRVGTAVVGLGHPGGTPLELGSGPAKMGPGAEVGSHPSAGVMGHASLSTAQPAGSKHLHVGGITNRFLENEQSQDPALRTAARWTRTKKQKKKPSKAHRAANNFY